MAGPSRTCAVSTNPFLPSEIHSAFAYYYDHQAEIDAEIGAEWESVKSLGNHSSPFVRRMRAEGRL